MPFLTDFSRERNTKEYVCSVEDGVWVLTWAYLAIVPHPVSLHDALKAGCELVGSQQRGRSVGARDAVHEGRHGGITFSLLEKKRTPRKSVMYQPLAHREAFSGSRVKHSQVWAVHWAESSSLARSGREISSENSQACSHIRRRICWHILK